MDKKVAIAGYRMKGACDLITTRERLTFELTRGLFDDLGIDRHYVDTVIFSTNDFLDGRTISNVFLDPPAGAYLKDESKVEMDGLNALMYAFMRIQSGEYESALLVALSLCGYQVSPYLYIEYTLNPAYDRQLGLLNELSAAGLQAQSFLSKYGYSEDLIDEIAAQNLRNAALNPDQARGMNDASGKDVKQSPYLYEPLRELHTYPATDGGCAVLLVSEDKAGELTDKPVWVLGMGQSIETYYLGERGLYESRSTREAAERAYRMAGIDDPKRKVDFAEVSSLFAPQEPILCEALGLYDPGGAAAAYGGDNDISGSLPINPSGGPLGAHPICATGLFRLNEAVKQLRGEAGKNQVKKAEVAVVHAQDGVCAQQNAVVVLGT
jgi:acetyl-CoA C-acetyltransferase